MDLFEKINRSFGTWYEGLFGGGDDVRPKDILRRILAAMEDNRKEGFDSKVYVPNQYILEIDVEDEEEKEYLLSFLDRDELEAAIRRYCQQNHYHIRGALDFTVKEVAEEERAPGARRPEKVRVRCRYNSRISAPEPVGAVAAAATPPIEDRTVANAYEAVDIDDSGTVPSVVTASMMIYAPNRPPFRYAVARGSVTIGRSGKLGNDIVIETDGQVSKTHARIEMEPDRRFTLYDLGSTNGTKVNGRRIENRTLNDGDEITIGDTRITFQQPRVGRPGEDLDPVARHYATTTADASVNALGRFQGAFGGAAARLSPNAETRDPGRSARLVLTDRDQDLDDFILASETGIGRAATNDIVLPDRSIATRHARIVRDGDGYAIEVLDGAGETSVNGRMIDAGAPTSLRDGDRIALGSLSFRFEGEP